jgi:two-component system KDP operon response regulator KdpE
MPHTILILDDDQIFRSKFAAREIKERGFRVLEASKIQEAKVLLARERPDLMIADGLLPDGNGIDFIAELRRGGSQIPVIFVSAFWKDMQTHARLTALGNVQVLRKPLRVGDLGNRVDFMLARGAIEIDIDLE